MEQSTYDLIDTVLITGGASGIGRAMAENFIRANKKVIIAGRTESKLQDTAKEIGATAYYVLDTGKVDQIPSFIKKILTEHPSLNCLINNAGVQRPFLAPGANFTDSDYGFDLSKADQEIDINIRGPMHLTVGFLPHFTSLPNGKSGVLINVSSVLGFNPSSLINPVYNGTKAWIHSFTINMRTQLQKSDARVKIVEIVPPTVATDLHRERTNPDDNKKENNKAALEIGEFMDEVEQGLKSGKEIIAPGIANGVVKIWEEGMGVKYHAATDS